MSVVYHSKTRQNTNQAIRKVIKVIYSIDIYKEKVLKSNGISQQKIWDIIEKTPQETEFKICNKMNNMTIVAHSIKKSKCYENKHVPEQML